MGHYENFHSYDTGNYTNNFEDNMLCYNDINYLNVDNSLNNFENEFCLSYEAIDDIQEKDYLLSLNDNSTIKYEKELNDASNFSFNNHSVSNCDGDYNNYSNNRNNNYNNYSNNCNNFNVNDSNFKKRRAFDHSILNNKKIKKSENLCIICLKNEKKYKFACCCDYYCSVYCFNMHNKEECLKRKKNEINKVKNANYAGNDHNNLSNNNTHVSSNNEINEPNEDGLAEEYNLTEEQKNKLKNDKKLKLLLKIKYVRSVFKDFTRSNDKISYLSQYINDPEIIQVVDQIMKAIGE